MKKTFDELFNTVIEEMGTLAPSTPSTTPVPPTTTASSNIPKEAIDALINAKNEQDVQTALQAHGLGPVASTAKPATTPAPVKPVTTPAPGSNTATPQTTPAPNAANQQSH